MVGRIGAAAGGIAGVAGLVAVAASARAEGGYDPWCGWKCEEIRAESPEHYEELLTALEYTEGAVIEPWPGIEDPSTIPQLWEGTTGVIVPSFPGSFEGEEFGKVYTRFVDGEGWVERWVIREPDATLSSSLRLPYLGQGTFEEGVHELHENKEAESYQVLTFAFRYLCPPSDEAMSKLPTEVPEFVTDVYRFRVFFTENGEEQEAGALYRERMDFDQQIWWQDTWVLWENFDLPHPDPVLAAGREVRLEAVAWGGETVRAFLGEQMYSMPGRCVVRTRSTVEPVP